MNKTKTAIREVKKVIRACKVNFTARVNGGILVICEGEQPLFWSEKTGKIRGLNVNYPADIEILKQVDSK